MDRQLNSIADTITDWFSCHDAPSFIVTDPDIELEAGGGDILEFYSDLLAASSQIEVVGPMLRIDDLPEHYPLKAEVIRRHTDQFWHKTPEHLLWRGKELLYQQALIDTTFGMYRKGFQFHRLSRGLRTYAPYAARHLDWYLNPQELSDDQRYYMKHASTVSHWGGAWLRDYLREA